MVLKEFLSPQASVIAEQHKFYTRMQHEGETISSYVAELKRITINCNFQCTSCEASTIDTHLRAQFIELKRITINCNFQCTSCEASTIDTHLRAQFIRGIRDSESRERLLQQKATIKFEEIVQIAQSIETSKKEAIQQKATIKFEEIVQIAQSIETSKKEAIQIQSNYTVHAIQENKTKQTNIRPTRYRSKPGNAAKDSKIQELRGKCFKCGKSNHKANTCYAKNLKCKHCGKQGHIEAVCLKKNSMVKEQKQLHVASDSEDEIFPINKVEKNDVDTDKIFISVEINKKRCEMELDTGAAVSTMSQRQFKKLWPTHQIISTTTKLRTYTGEIIHPVGTADMTFTTTKLRTYTGEIIHPVGTADMTFNYKQQSAKGTLFILPKEVDAIFRRDWLVNSTGLEGNSEGGNGNKLIGW
ncbi:hypothetical protein QE152_g38248 [Popillia japonica]|uniref:CCHC-type domain-containing protein n=1 Tax=Popillia japonica TaxID=7064 RepID=A0AAW1I8H8_POPJA